MLQQEVQAEGDPDAQYAGGGHAKAVQSSRQHPAHTGLLIAPLCNLSFGCTIHSHSRGKLIHHNEVLTNWAALSPAPACVRIRVTSFQSLRLSLTSPKLRDVGNSSRRQMRGRGQQRTCTCCYADKRGLGATSARKIKCPHIAS